MAVSLPPLPWIDTPGMAAILAALPGARLVGGCVRDALAGQTPKDIDIATQFLPDQVTQRLEAAGIKAVPTGIEHGTITAVASGDVVEVTSLRKDVSTDGRRAIIAYTSDWREDAARRDFTINALYADPATGEVFDWFGGQDDLAAGIVRFIGEPLQRIAEDHLRILRFFRFSARFAKAGFDQGIFRPVLPEITDAAPLARLVAREAEQGVAADSLRRLSALLPADARMAEDVGARLKLSNAQRKRLMTAAVRARDEVPQVLAYWLGSESAVDRLLLGDGDACALSEWTPPKFPLSGGAIVARGVQAGPDVARILQAAERQWVAEGFPDAARVEAILAGLL